MTKQLGASGTPDAPSFRLYLSSFSHLRHPRVRRILSLAGYACRVGIPDTQSLVALWGTGPTAARGRKLAAINGAGLLYLEDGFLRSVRPGRSGEAPSSLLLDTRAPYFDASVKTDLEEILQNSPLDAPDELRRAQALIDTLRHSGVSKYNTADGPVPEPGFILVADQTFGDRAIAGAQATDSTFAEMLRAARAEHPGRRILVQQHPETTLGLRAGHFENVPEDVQVLSTPAPPYQLLEAAHAVYTVSSQLGFEAILCGHRPVVFGQAFYAGWGLTDDRAPACPRRSRTLTPAQLALGVLIKYPLWYDPYHDRLTEPEQVVAALAAQARAYREDTPGSVGVGMRLWKRHSMSRFFQNGPMRFAETREKAIALASAKGKRVLEWGGRGVSEHSATAPIFGVEDGFVRSAGLGAQLVPALSLVCDPRGMYYDPETPSALEGLISQSASLPQSALAHAADIRRRLISGHITKYNLKPEPVELPEPQDRRVLVVGQVEDDASVQFGAVGPVRTNTELYDAARRAHPAAQLIFKPHPDVEAGLRPGSSPRTADVVARNTDTITLIDCVDEVWTMTSLLGFEALIRGRPVVTLGIPFYAGWGLTRDLAPADHPAFSRRAARGVTLEGLVYAALLQYPRYHDPVSNLACPLDVILDRLEDGSLPKATPALRTLSKLQGVFASYRGIWR